MLLLQMGFIPCPVLVMAVVMGCLYGCAPIQSSMQTWDRSAFEWLAFCILSKLVHCLCDQFQTLLEEHCWYTSASVNIEIS